MVLVSELRICWKCSGEISKEDITCPSCGEHTGNQPTVDKEWLPCPVSTTRSYLEKREEIEKKNIRDVRRANEDRGYLEWEYERKLASVSVSEIEGLTKDVEALIKKLLSRDIPTHKIRHILAVAKRIGAMAEASDNYVKLRGE